MNVKRIVLVALAIMMVSTVAMTAMAADQLRIKDKDQVKDGSCLDSATFVDADGDGICDNYVDGVCTGINCQGTGDCDGDQARDGSCNEDCDGEPDQDRARDGSCQD